MSQKYDCLVIGAGFAGAVCARELAERGGKRVPVSYTHLDVYKRQDVERGNQGQQRAVRGLVLEIPALEIGTPPPGPVIILHVNSPPW